MPGGSVRGGRRRRGCGLLTLPGTTRAGVIDDDPVTTGTTDVVDATDDIITTDWCASAMAEAWLTTGDASSGSTSVGWLVSSESETNMTGGTGAGTVSGLSTSSNAQQPTVVAWQPTHR